jgi:hypothetical protein
MKTFLCVMAALVLYSTSCFAGIKTTGRGDTLNFDAAAIPSSMRASFDVMKIKCIKCHTMERTVQAIRDGIAPITGQPFDRAATRAYGIKMLRKPDSNMNKQEVKVCVDLMNYLLDEASK